MKKIILSSLIVFSLLSPVSFISLAVPAQACPVREPSTLLTLYKNSDAIHIARFAGDETGKSTKDDEYTVTEKLKHYDVSSTLKGEAVKAITLVERDYEYNPEPS